MINLREMLTENRDMTAKKGCLMAMLSKEDTAKILQFSKQLIKDEDLYLEGNEYGRENESHVTIRYGFLKDLNELDVRQLLKGHKPFLVELIGLDKFDPHPKYDVAVFKVNSLVLRELNEMSGIHLNESDFPDYNPHLTLAYTQKGRFNKIKEGLNLKVLIKEICYSPISGDKSYFTLEESHNIDEEIARLWKEWERLDPMGNQDVRQRAIVARIKELEKEKEHQVVPPEEGPRVFNQLRKDAGLLNEGLKSVNSITPKVLKQMAAAAQKIYDDWKQNEEGYDEELGVGGICHLIADGLADILGQLGIECSSVSSSYEQHVYLVVKFREGVYSIDIPYQYYESGGGFNWKKLPNIVFDESRVVIDKLDSNSKNFNKYVDNL